jgi:hypothetical protein
LDLLKYLHNLCTLDLYDLVGRRSGKGVGFFLNARGRVLFEAMMQPSSDLSARWLAAGATIGTETQRGPAGVSRMGLVAAPAAQAIAATKELKEEAMKQAQEAASSPSSGPAPFGFFLSTPQASLPLALAHLQQYNLRRKVVVEDVSTLYDVYQLIPYSVLEAQRQPPSAASPLPPNEDPSEVARLLGLESEEQVQQALGECYMVDPRTRNMGVRVIVPKGTKRKTQNKKKEEGRRREREKLGENQHCFSTSAMRLVSLNSSPHISRVFILRLTCLVRLLFSLHLCFCSSLSPFSLPPFLFPTRLLPLLARLLPHPARPPLLSPRACV